MSYVVDFKDVSTVGLESSPVVDALAGLRANEARYFKNKYDHEFTVEPASKAKKVIELGAQDPRATRHRHRVAARSRPHVPGRDASLRVRVLRERPVHQRDVRHGGPEEAGGRLQAVRGDGRARRARLEFKFARQKSKLAGTIRGSYFVVKGEY